MEECRMTAVEASRLADWLIAHGMTAEQALECIKFIATGFKKEND